MPLLENDQLVEDSWVAVDDEAPLPDAPAIISLARLLRDAPVLAGRNAPLGVAIDNTVNPDAVAPFLPRLDLVQVTMPGSRDGRAFTQIRALREYHGFGGEIRVTGHVIPDHYGMLLRCGASSVVVREGADPAVWEASRRVVNIAYQHAQAAAQPLSLLRRRVA
jgi:uncharacterized protein (DUF934 family)